MVMQGTRKLRARPRGHANACLNDERGARERLEHNVELREAAGQAGSRRCGGDQTTSPRLLLATWTSAYSGPLDAPATESGGRRSGRHLAALEVANRRSAKLEVVARDGIEPSTRGFSIQRTGRFGASKLKAGNALPRERPNCPPRPSLFRIPLGRWAYPGGPLPIRVNELRRVGPNWDRTVSPQPTPHRLQAPGLSRPDACPACADWRHDVRQWRGAVHRRHEGQ